MSGSVLSCRHIPPWGILQLPPGRISLRRRPGVPSPMEHQNKPQLLNRLNRIEGQVRGIARMVEEDRYCIDVLTQLQAVRAALSRVESEMLKSHLNHCIESAIVAGDADDQRRTA